MALHRGIQSAIFYYVSCAPCADARYRKKRKKEAVRGRADREALEAEMPGVYRHPSPSSTNPHWQAEIAAGPTLSARGKKKQNGAGGSGRGLKTSMTQRSNRSDLPSSLDVRSVGSRDGRTDSKIDFRRYQRDDEERPWVSDASTDRLASKTTLDGSLRSGGSGVTRPPRAYFTAEDYSNRGNPAINDLQPATVTKIGSREEASWLMQPPPLADVMSGKERAPPRSRSDSGGSSRLSARSVMPLSREVTQRIIEQKLRNGDLLPMTSSLSVESSAPTLTSNNPRGQRHDRDSVDEHDFAFDDSPTSRREKRRQTQVQIQASEDSTKSAATVIHNHEASPDPSRARRLASKPQLSTIASDSLLPADVDDTLIRTPKENRRSLSGDERDRTARRSALLPPVKDDSLRVLHELAPASPIFKTQVVSSQDLKRDGVPTNRRRRMSSEDASPSPAVGDERPEMYDSWYTPDFELPEWVHEHTKREGVKERWSMDF